MTARRKAHVEFVVVPIALGWGLLWLWALVDIGARSDDEFHRAGESKAIWFVLVLVLQFFGLLGYLLLVRPRLERARGL